MKADLLKKIKHPYTHSSLRFKELEEKGDKVIVTYFGHEVGGSYVPESAVVPGYIADLEYSTNRKVKFKSRSSWGFGADLYTFRISLKSVIYKNQYKPKGTLLRASCATAFYKDLGHSWAFCHILYQSLLDKKIPKKSNIVLKNKSVFIDNIEIFKIIEYTEDETFTVHGHGTSKTRTQIHAIYDLLIPEHKFIQLYLDKQKEILNILLDKTDVTCDKASIEMSENSGYRLILYFSNGLRFDICSHWFLMTSLKLIEEYIKKSYVNVIIDDGGYYQHPIPIEVNEITLSDLINMDRLLYYSNYSNIEIKSHFIIVKQKIQETNYSLVRSVTRTRTYKCYINRQLITDLNADLNRKLKPNDEILFTYR